MDASVERVHRSPAAAAGWARWERGGGTCLRQGWHKTAVLVTYQMLFVFPNCRGAFSLRWGCGSREIQSDQKNY